MALAVASLSSDRVCRVMSRVWVTGNVWHVRVPWSVATRPGLVVVFAETGEDAVQLRVALAGRTSCSGPKWRVTTMLCWAVYLLGDIVAHVLVRGLGCRSLGLLSAAGRRGPRSLRVRCMRPGSSPHSSLQVATSYCEQYSEPRTAVLSHASLATSGVRLMPIPGSIGADTQRWLATVR